MEFQLSKVKEVVVVGDKGNELEREVLEGYLPDAVVAIAPDAGEKDLPLLTDRPMIDGAPTAYVCESFVCQRPVTDVEQLRLLLRTEPAD
jgi:uncharacterized protein YyaL (SSP411 family)